MAYNKKYAELGESVIDYVNDREDAIEGAFLTAHEISVNVNTITARWDSGLQISVIKLNYNGLLNTAHGSLYRTANPLVANFSKNFSQPPHFVKISPMDGRNIGGYPVTVRSDGIDLYMLSSINYGGVATETQVSVLAVGRWK